MERNGAEGERPGLRIGGYVPGHAEPVAGSGLGPGPGDGPQPANLPNIADYWPDGPGNPSRVAGMPPDFEDFGEPPPERRRRGKTVLLVGLLAGAVAAGTLLLMRPSGNEDPVETAAPATSVPATVAPSLPSVEPTAVEESAPPPPALTNARFDLISGVTELNVRTADLNGENFKVTTPKSSGLNVDATFTDGTLKVKASPDGAEKGSGQVDVLLSRDVVWRLRMTAGVQRASFDMGGGTVSDIDIIGGAKSIDIELGNLDGTLPILMAGGVGEWRISTPDEVPVQIEFTSGAGDVRVYGRAKGGVGEGLTVKVGDLAKQPGLDIDAEAGLGSLEISKD